MWELLEYTVIVTELLSFKDSNYLHKRKYVSPFSPTCFPIWLTQSSVLVIEVLMRWGEVQMIVATQIQVGCSLLSPEKLS